MSGLNEIVARVAMLVCYDIHLTVSAVELQAETSAVAKTQEERLAPRGPTPAMTDAIA